MGIKNIMQAKKILLIAGGEEKAEALKKFSLLARTHNHPVPRIHFTAA